nr:hypothetical protein BaRGS_006912 [Batillaria attramentaria]
MTSVSTMDLGGKEDYIYLAAGQICLAQNSEASGQYQMAFNYYKTGVGILLQGVQGDTNKARRDAVRRKTAQYLMKAEDLYNHHLATENLDERRWAADSYVSPSLELDPSFAFIRGSVRDLRHYQVLGAIDKVILVLDRSTDETYVIKTIPKMAAGTITADNSQRSILPTTCPYMVNLQKFFETDYAIYLLLQYASGGRLWSYIAAYLQQSSSGTNAAGDGHNLVDGFSAKGNVYMGQKMHQDANAVVDTIMSKEADSRTLTEKRGGDLVAKRVLPTTGIRFSDLQAKLKSPDSDNGDTSGTAHRTPMPEEKDSLLKKDSLLDDTSITDPRSLSAVDAGDENFSRPREDSILGESSTADARRLSSLSSEEFHRSISQEDARESTDRFPELGETDEAADRFHDLLRQNKVNLENFSINSFDSDNVRLSSTFSTSEVPAEADLSGQPTSPQHSDLFEQLDHETPEHVVLPEAVVRRWAAELVIALSRLHALGIICRAWRVVLDAGFLRVGQAEKELDWNAVEQMYVAPEVRSISGSDTSCDWWSFGALLYELLVGKSLHLCHPGGILPYTNIFIPSHVSDEGRNLLQELLRYNPRERLGSGVAGAEEIKAHNFFSSIDWHHLEYV